MFSKSGNTPDIDDHVREVEQLYERVIRRQFSARVVRCRGPWRITFDTNPNQCNLHCIMCEEHSHYTPRQDRRRKEGRPQRTMPFDMLERVVAQAVPHGLREIIPSTMGEPLLYEHFECIVELCRRHNVKLNLMTNGTFPMRGATRWAEIIVPVASDVKISWNGATEGTLESIMVGSRWDTLVGSYRR